MIIINYNVIFRYQLLFLCVHMKWHNNTLLCRGRLSPSPWWPAWTSTFTIRRVSHVTWRCPSVACRLWLKRRSMWNILIPASSRPWRRMHHISRYDVQSISIKENNKACLFAYHEYCISSPWSHQIFSTTIMKFSLKQRLPA